MKIFGAKTDDVYEAVARELTVRPVAKSPALGAPYGGYAPKPEYSLEQAAGLLHRHITELDETEASLSEQIFAAETQLVELKRRLAVTQTTSTIMKEAAAKLIDQSVASKPPYIKPTLREVPKPEAERELPSFLKAEK